MTGTTRYRNRYFEEGFLEMILSMIIFNIALLNMNENCIREIDRYISVILPLYVFHTIRTIQIKVRKKVILLKQRNYYQFEFDDVRCFMHDDAGRCRYGFSK